MYIPAGVVMPFICTVDCPLVQVSVVISLPVASSIVTFMLLVTGALATSISELLLVCAILYSLAVPFMLVTLSGL